MAGKFIHCPTASIHSASISLVLSSYIFQKFYFTRLRKTHRHGSAFKGNSHFLPSFLAFEPHQVILKVLFLASCTWIKPILVAYKANTLPTVYHAHTIRYFILFFLFFC